jgi:hypothetical protein
MATLAPRAEFEPSSPRSARLSTSASSLLFKSGVQSHHICPIPPGCFRVSNCCRSADVLISAPFAEDAVISAAKFRQSLKLLALVPVVGCPASALAQLPPPNVLLTEPRPAVIVIGPADVHLRASTSFIYDDNISLHDQPRIVPGISARRVDPPLGDDFILTFAPGVALTKATTLEDSRTAFGLDYSPAFLFFMKNSQENSIDHTAKFNAGYGFTKLTLALVQDFASTSGGVVDVGTRVNQMNYRTGISARYEVTEKTFLQGEGTFSIRDYETLTDSQEWSFTPTANYQISPKVTLGLGLTVGQLLVDQQMQESFVIPSWTNQNTGFVTDAKTNQVTKVVTRKQTYFGPTLRANYKTTEKTEVSITFGGEWRSYDDGRSSFGPVFSVNGSYQPWQGTRFSLEAHRREQNSAVLSGANYISTGVSLSGRQELAQRLSGHMQVSYDNAAYKPTSRGISTSREDDYYLMRYGLDAILGRSWTIGVFHQYREDISSEKSFSFRNNQVGIQAAWGY